MSHLRSVDHPTLDMDLPRPVRVRRRRVEPQFVELPEGVYFAGPVELKGASITDPGIIDIKLVAAVMPKRDYFPDAVLLDKEKHQRPGDENREMRLYVWPIDRQPTSPEYVLEPEAEDDFLVEAVFATETWSYQIAGGYQWQAKLTIQVGPLTDILNVKVAEWLIALGTCYLIIVDPQGDRILEQVEQ